MPRLAGHRIEGLSVGGVETCIDCPELKLAFDVGRCPDEAVNRPTILFTHAHMDHMGGVAWHAATRALRGLAPPTYVVPRENETDFPNHGFLPQMSHTAAIGPTRLPEQAVQPAIARRCCSRTSAWIGPVQANSSDPSAR